MQFTFQGFSFISKPLNHKTKHLQKDINLGCNNIRGPTKEVIRFAEDQSETTSRRCAEELN